MFALANPGQARFCFTREPPPTVDRLSDGRTTLDFFGQARDASISMTRTERPAELSRVSTLCPPKLAGMSGDSLVRQVRDATASATPF